MSVGKILQEQFCSDLPHITATLGTALLGGRQRKFLKKEPGYWGL